MKYLPFATALLLSATFVSCDLDDDDDYTTCGTCQEENDNAHDYVIIDDAEYNEAQVVGVNVDSLSLSGDSLTVFFSASGCDGNSWEMYLFDSGTIIDSTSTDSIPAARSLVFSLENNEECEAYISSFATFDLSPIQLSPDTSLLINFYNTGEQILYEY